MSKRFQASAYWLPFFAVLTGAAGPASAQVAAPGTDALDANPVIEEIGGLDPLPRADGLLICSAHTAAPRVTFFTPAIAARSTPASASACSGVD